MKKKQIATAGFDGRIRIWDTEAQSLHTSEDEFRRHFPIETIGKGKNILSKEYPNFGWQLTLNKLIQDKIIGKYYTFVFSLVICTFLMYIIKSDPILRKQVNINIFFGIAIFIGIYGVSLAFYSLFKVNQLYKSDPSHMPIDKESRWKTIIRNILLFPISPFFKAYKCPMCGVDIMGRKNFFFCSQCDWQEKRPLTANEIIERNLNKKKGKKFWNFFERFAEKIFTKIFEKSYKH